MKVSGVVVSHGHAAELEQSLPALAPQVDELVVVANVPGSAEGLPEGTRLLENPDPVPEPDAVRRLVEFADAHPRAGAVGPQMLYADGEWQPARRRFPT